MSSRSIHSFAIGNSVITPERPRRVIKQSQKALAISSSGEKVPGLPPSSDPAVQLSSSSHIRAQREPSPSPSLTQLDMAVNHSLPRMANSNSPRMPAFSAAQFQIYNWRRPRPTSFANLSEERKAEKRRFDEQGKSTDIDDGSDDWYEYSGVREDYTSRDDGFAMEHSIACTFMHRAKRAFWAGKSWVDFEFKERVIDSEAGARSEKDERKRALLLEHALDNDLRLAVFDAVKKRLCEEIWLEPYRPATGLHLLPPSRTDSKVTTPDELPRARASPADRNAEVSQHSPTSEERQRGITRWSVDGHGIRQPLYGNETTASHGMRDFMRYMREAPPSRDPSLRGLGATIGRIGVNGVVSSMSRTEELGYATPDFSTSEEEDN